MSSHAAARAGNINHAWCNNLDKFFVAQDSLTASVRSGTAAKAAGGLPAILPEAGTSCQCALQLQQ